MYVQEVQNILNTDIEEIIKTSMSLNLLKCYSHLYLNGGQPRTCANSQRKYYNQLKINGLKMAQEKDKLGEKTHVLSWSGIRYIQGIFKDGKLVAGHLHINSENLTDDKAIEYLKKGVLKKSDFNSLPKGYNSK